MCMRTLEFHKLNVCYITRFFMQYVIGNYQVQLLSGAQFQFVVCIHYTLVAMWCGEDPSYGQEQFQLAFNNLLSHRWVICVQRWCGSATCEYIQEAEFLSASTCVYRLLFKGVCRSTHVLVIPVVWHYYKVQVYATHYS